MACDGHVAVDESADRKIDSVNANSFYFHLLFYNLLYLVERKKFMITNSL